MPDHSNKRVYRDASDASFMRDVARRASVSSQNKYTLIRQDGRLVIQNSAPSAACTPSSPSARTSSHVTADSWMTWSASSLAASLPSPSAQQRTRTRDSDTDRRCLSLLRHPHVLARLSPGRVAAPSHSLGAVTACPPRLLLPALFRSLCICDIKLAGQPIQMASRDFRLGPRGLRVGACEFLNLQTRRGGDYSLTAERSGGGRLGFVLELAVPLVSARTGELKVVLAAQMDVTAVVRQLQGSVEYGENTSRAVSTGSSANGADTTDWLALAQDDARAGGGGGASVEHAHMSTAALVDLGELMADLRFFHRDCFVLGRAPEAELGWGMVWATGGVFASGPELETKLCCSAPAVRSLLAVALGGEQAFTVRVRWGVRGVGRRVYGVPLWRGGGDGGAGHGGHGGHVGGDGGQGGNEGGEERRPSKGGGTGEVRRVRCWACFVVDGRVPDLFGL